NRAKPCGIRVPSPHFFDMVRAAHRSKSGRSCPRWVSRAADHQRKSAVHVRSATKADKMVRASKGPPDASFAPEPKIAGAAGTDLNRFEIGTFNESRTTGPRSGRSTERRQPVLRMTAMSQ